MSEKPLEQSFEILPGVKKIRVVVYDVNKNLLISRSYIVRKNKETILSIVVGIPPEI